MTRQEKKAKSVYFGVSEMLLAHSFSPEYGMLLSSGQLRCHDIRTRKSFRIAFQRLLDNFQVHVHAIET